MRIQKLMLAGAVAALLAVASNGYAEPTEATGSVSGKVNGPDGQPAAGVAVKAMAAQKGKRSNDDGEKAGKKEKAPSYTGTTDDAGRYTIENIPAGTYTINATAKGVGRAKGNATVVAGRDFTVNMQLERPKRKS